MLINLAGARFHLKSYVEAEALLGRAVAIREAAFGPNDSRLISALRYHAQVLRKLSRKQDALEIESRVKAFRN